VETVTQTPTSAADEPARPNPWMRAGRWIAFLLVAGLIALLAWGVVKANNGPVNSGLAPDFTLTTFDGRAITLSQLRGQVVVVNFWASWCVPCRQEADYLERTWRKYQDRGVVFIGVNWVDTDKEARVFLDEFGITYINGPDLGTRIAQAYRIRGIPETFFVDKAGQLRAMKIGPFAPPELENRLDELLKEQ